MWIGMAQLPCWQSKGESEDSVAHRQQSTLARRSTLALKPRADITRSSVTLQLGLMSSKFLWKNVFCSTRSKYVHLIHRMFFYIDFLGPFEPGGWPAAAAERGKLGKNVIRFTTWALFLYTEPFLRQYSFHKINFPEFDDKKWAFRFNIPN